MKTLTTLFVFLFCLAACASDRITASITVTNLTTNGMTFTVNGNVRTFTTNVTVSSTQVLTNSDATGCGSKTNLFTQISLNLFSFVTPTSTGSNTFQLQGACGSALIVTASAGWASVSYSTQTCTTATSVISPFSAYPAVNTRTNTASQLVTDLNNYDTNAISQSAPIAGQLLGTSNTQTIYGAKDFNNTNSFFRGRIVQPISETNFLWGGFWQSGFFASPTTTNLVNYGSAFRSPGSAPSSEQIGAAASATGESSLAFGPVAIASGENSISIGAGSIATTDGDIAIGPSAFAYFGLAVGPGTIATNNSAAFGIGARATGLNSMALASSATASHSNSIAMGVNAATTASNQIMLGAPGISTVVQNDLTVQTNATVGGNLVVGGNASIGGTLTNLSALNATVATNLTVGVTNTVGDLQVNTNANVAGVLTAGVASAFTFSNKNNFPAGSDIAFGRFPISSLASGNNAAVPVGTNVLVEVSGPSAAFNINGIANGRDGKLLVLLNLSGQVMTIANESGTDPVAANRIRTLTGADLATFTNSICTLIYNASVSRWILLSAGTVATITNVNASQITGSITASQIYTPITQTNFVLNQLYTNLTGGGIAVHALASLTTAAVAGSSEMDLMVAQTGSTFAMIDGPKLITSISAVTGAMQFGLNGSVQTNGVYYFTNSSSGAGDSSSIISGSGQVTGL